MSKKALIVLLALSPWALSARAETTVCTGKITALPFTIAVSGNGGEGAGNNQ